ncbi:transcriptional regulator, IclR family [Alteribacillus persepolensis]|uniref:Glycerol operon regulatory protein n=1 Tax=Alteribacillus persepolensis TaxID=568899 RepID=A0A1G8J8W6_9BACI|nr:IclR family transcriptional regulator [Alteribacillus persepolensis]SDI27708.1 transcriptional regulator, IclR family [Alteribacillus persepolensis]
MISSVRKAAQILNCFTEDEPALRNLDIAQKLDMSTSTVYRLVHSLCQEGMLIKDSTNRYRLGWKLLELGNMVMYQKDIYDEAVPRIEELTRKFRGTVHIGMLDENGDFIFVLKVAAKDALQVPTFIGERKPTYCFSTGKVLLSSNPSLMEKFTSKDLLKRGPNTIGTVEGLRVEMNQVKNNGFAVSNNENEFGVYGIAAPIQSYSGKNVAALNMVGPISYIQGREKQNMVKHVTKVADSISKDLGYIFEE